VRVCRFYVLTIPDSGETLRLSREESRHATRVLRLQAGQVVELLDGAGVRASATIACSPEGRRDTVLCRVVERHDCRPPSLRVRLYVALPRRKVMGQIVRDATQLGVWRISPVICRYAVSRPGSGTQTLAWQADAVAALKQSGNAFVPRIDTPCPFDEAVAQATHPGYFGAVPDTGAGGAVRVAPGAGELALWVGPEAGFSSEEQTQLVQRGSVPLSIGRWTLTIEAAVPALLGALLGKFGDDSVRYQDT